MAPLIINKCTQVVSRTDEGKNKMKRPVKMIQINVIISIGYIGK
jgi:hypothetical protein